MAAGDRVGDLRAGWVEERHAAAAKTAARLRPELILLDDSTPAAIKRLHAAAPNAKILVLGLECDPAYANRASTLARPATSPAKQSTAPCQNSCTGSPKANAGSSACSNAAADQQRRWHSPTLVTRGLPPGRFGRLRW